MSITVKYSSTRREVWSLYWRLWQQRLWKTHLIIFLAAATSGSFALDHWPMNVPDGIVVVLVGLIPIALLALYPMLVFKPQTRILTVDDHTISTTIGKHDRSIDWVEIANVRNDGEALIIQRHNLNAFIVPARAFGSPEARSSFEEFVKAHVRRG